MTPSPGTSGTSLLSTIKARKQAQDVYSSDPKFKKFGLQIEKCLVTFDNVQEWADCIAFLKTLLKTLQTYTQFKDIPRKPIVSKRLCQCLNPALPTGVHQRALEVYSHIFSVIGPEGIERDLSLWTSGLFPFFEYTATSIKPTLVKIYTTHLLPLQEALRPSMRAFIICLLPGLEEETGEFFDQVLSLLDRLSGVVSPAFFFQNIWLILLTTPTARGTALNLLSRRLPRMKPDEDIVPIVGNDTGLFIRAFAAALGDENLLVQRAALDLQLQILPLNSKTLREAGAEDREIIMRAAYSVVLRRDLSLNRRLYTWLLGPEESPQAQETFFRQFGLPLLGQTLKVDMRVPHGSLGFARPFKVFISLLDKWEIGGPLTDLLLVEVLKILQIGVAEESAGNSKEIYNTANNLCDSVDPGLLWKHLLNLVITDLSATSDSSQGIALTAFVVRDFHHDDDVQTNHFPIVLAAILELLKDRLKSRHDTISEVVAQRVMELVEVLVANTPSLQRISRPALPNSTSLNTNWTAVDFSRQYYGLDVTPDSDRTSRTIHRPVATVLEDLIDIAAVSIGKHTPATSLSISARSLALVRTILQRSTSQGQEHVSLAIDASHWLSELLVSTTEQLRSFAVLRTLIDIAVELQRDDGILYPVVLDDHTQIETMMRALFHYLLPEYAAYHHQAVALLWSLDDLSSAFSVESMIAQQLCGSQPTVVLQAYEAFGTLWRLTDDEALPGVRLHTPMLIVLRSLSSDDISLQRAAESWLRMSLRSVLRVIDPLLAELQQHNAATLSEALHIQGRDIRAIMLARNVDQRRIHHILKLVLALIRHGGNSFTRVFRVSFIRDSHLTKLAIKDSNSSYMEYILRVLIGLLETEPQPKAEASQGPMNIFIHSTCIDILQAIISRGSIDEQVLDDVRDTVTTRLFLATHQRRIDIQDKLLHLLHSVFSALPVSRIPLAQSTTSSSDTTESQHHSSHFFTQVLIDGVSVTSNRPVYQHWFDFIVMTLPKPQYNLKASILPLTEAICQHIHVMLSNTISASDSNLDTMDNTKAASDCEWVMYLNALESLVSASLAGPSDGQVGNEIYPDVETTTDAGGLFGFFGSDTVAQATEDSKAVSSSDLRALRQCVSILFNITVSLADPRSKSHPHPVLLQRLRARAQRLYEQFWRSNSIEVLEWLAYLWGAEPEKLKNSIAQSVFDLVDSLESGAQSVVHMLCERITAKSITADRTRKQAPGGDSLEWSLFLFLEQYLQRLEGPLVAQVWPRFMQLAKDMASSARDSKLQAYATLRCMTVLTEDVSQASRFDDRRARKELQDTYTRLLDATISVVANRDAGAWSRRKELISNGRDSPIPRSTSATPLNEKAASVVDLTIVSDEKISEIIQYIANHVFPNVRRFFIDSDKIAAACNNVVHNLITPMLKGKLQPLDVNDNTLVLLKAATQVNGSLRSWRAPVYDAFNDARVFDSTPEAGQRWQGVISALIDSDKTVLSELLTKIAVAPSANIFANREYEMLMQSLNLRRLSYLVLASERNHYLTQLPSIVEKLVEIFKTVLSPVVQSEAYLCLRVLLCRLAPHNLTSFWPTILTELYNTFEQLLNSMPPDGSESLRLILAASKFVDLLLVLQTEEFQVHQWLFISDTVDAIYRPDDWVPVALLDQLAEVAVDLPVSDARSVDGTSIVNLPPTPSPLPGSRAAMRRPMLNKLRQIDSVRDLVPFFSHVSIASYESVYASPAAIDWVAVEEGILQDMFLGR